MNIDSTNNEIGVRIQMKMDEIGISQEKLAAKVGTSQNTISKIIRGIVKNSSFMPDIAEALGVTEPWLRYGDLAGNGKIINAQPQVWDQHTPLPEDVIAVPYFKEVSLSAGHGAINSDIPHIGSVLWFSKNFLRKQGACPEKVFCISVMGDSMEPRYEEGGIVVIDTTLPINIVDGKTYAIHYQGQDYIKYLRRMPDNKLLISSENEIYRPFEANADEVQVIGRVIAYQREE